MVDSGSRSGFISWAHRRRRLSHNKHQMGYHRPSLNLRAISVISWGFDLSSSSCLAVKQLTLLTNGHANGTDYVHSKKFWLTFI